LSAEELWRLYRGRADCENRIKELKYDFGGDSFNLKSFWATEAAFIDGYVGLQSDEFVPPKRIEK
jgi:hypothetical protein